MEENFLPSDLGSSSNRIYNDGEKKTIFPQSINSSPINSSPINSSSINSSLINSSSINSFSKPINTFSKPIQEFNNEKIETKKKVNFFVKMSNFVARRPKISLIFIMCLVLCILILIVYYRGILFLGPYCPNNIKSKKYKELTDKNTDKNTDKLSVDNNKILKSLR